jgi:glucose/arabinose dehydrogenase
MKKGLTRMVLGLTVFGATVFCAAQTQVYQSEEHAYRVVTVVPQLQNPWSIAFLPDGDILITERPGRLRIVRNNVLLPDPVEGVPRVRAQGQGGLLEVVAHPNFANNRLIYLSFSKPNEAGNQGTTAVVRGRFDGKALTNVQEIFEAKAWSNGGNHYAGKLAFDSRGYLFITVGDRQAPPNLQTAATHPAQLLTNHQGKVIRLHDDGRVPTDNPFAGRADALPEIWSYGHRNLQGLAIHPATGEVWQTEHAAQGGDELNVSLPGRNYGWPVIGYGVNYGGGVIHEGTHKEGMEQPVTYWLPSIGTSGLMFYTGDRFPRWRGSLFAGGLTGQQIGRITLDGHKLVKMEKIVERLGRIRDIRQGPDGYIYVAIDGRGGTPTPVIRLEPAQN